LNPRRLGIYDVSSRLARSVASLTIVCIILGWFGLGVAASLALLFIATSVAERERRAAAVAALLSGPPLAGLAVALLWDHPSRPWVGAGIFALGLAGTLACALPFGRREGIRVEEGERERVDERDALFHRFYRLEPGTPEFAAYYEQHPEQAELDDQIRALPGLGRPGSRSYDPLTAPYMVASFDVSEHLAREVRQLQPEPLSGAPVEAPAGELSRRVKAFARFLGADEVGCARLDPAHIYSHQARGPGDWGAPIYLDHPFAVAIAARMDHEMMRHAPRLATTVETAARYLDTTVIALTLARYITRLGFRARAHVDANYQVMCVPVAVDAGLGELGRLGLLITPRFGPRVRLAVVSTDMPLEPDRPLVFGVQRFCRICSKCAVNCPSDSVAADDKVKVRGVEKWQSAQESCYHYWRRCGSDCGICVKVCPYAHARSPAHDLVRWLVSRNPLARRLAFWGDDLAYGRRPRRRPPLERWLRPSGPGCNEGRAGATPDQNN
jgi:hypothetical protein